MLTVVARRLLAAVPLLLFLTFFVYALFELIPGDPAVAIAGDNGTAAEIADLRVRLDLDRPFLLRYLDFLGGLLRGDLGTSLFSSLSVNEAIVSRLPVTASLVLPAFVLVLLIAVPLGVLAGSRPGSKLDRLAGALASMGIALPVFFIGALLILLLARTFSLFPGGGYVPLTEDPVQWAYRLVLPVTALTLAGLADVFRQSRAGIISVLEQDYVRTALAQGATRGQLLRVHAWRNAMVPVVTVLGLQLARLVGLTVLLETLFGMPGVGQLAADAVVANDIPVVQGVVLYIAVFVIAANLLVDISYGYFNPKVRSA